MPSSAAQAASISAGNGMEPPPSPPEAVCEAAACGSSPAGAAPIDSATEPASRSTAFGAPARPRARRAARPRRAPARRRAAGADGGAALRRELAGLGLSLAPCARLRAAPRAARPSARWARAACRCGCSCESGSKASTASTGSTGPTSASPRPASGSTARRPAPESDWRRSPRPARAARGRRERAAGGWADEGVTPHEIAQRTTFRPPLAGESRNTSTEMRRTGATV